MKHLLLCCLFPAFTDAAEPAVKVFLFEGKAEPRVVTIDIPGHAEREIALLTKGFPQANYDRTTAKRAVREHPLAKLVGQPELDWTAEKFTAKQLVADWGRQGEGRLLRVDMAPAPLPYTEQLTAKLVQLLDTNGDGKLTQEELAAAPKLLEKHDADDDGCLVAFELVPSLLTEADPKRAKREPLRVAVVYAGYTNDDAMEELRVARPNATPEQLAAWLKQPPTSLVVKTTEPQRRTVASLDWQHDSATDSPVWTLSVVPQARGWFELLDTNHDGQLSQRELRNAWRSLATEVALKTGAIDIAPPSNPLTLTLTPGTTPRRGVLLTRRVQPIEAPEWFLAWDRNGDGDVSRPEFLGTDTAFRKLDRDGDGLISAAEAKGGATP